MTRPRQRGTRTVAIVQRPPVLLDMATSLGRAVEAIEEAAGADLGRPAIVDALRHWRREPA